MSTFVCSSSSLAIPTVPRTTCVRTSVRRCVQVTSSTGPEPTLQAQGSPVHQRAVRIGLAGLAALQLSSATFSGPALAELDTTTQEAGPAAKVEGSNLADQSGSDVLAQLQDVAIPGVEAALAKVDTAEAKNAASQLSVVQQAVSDLNEQVEKGLNDQAVKSAASGIEQQLNAAKSIAGLD